MTARERTRQQLDPAGTIGSRLIAVGAALAAFIYADVMTVRSGDQVAEPLFAVLALVALGFACIVVIVQTSPLRAPLSARVHAAVLIPALIAAGFSTAAGWGADKYVRDDWPPISLGLLFLALVSYRPAREVVGAGIVSAILLGFLVLLQTPGFVTDAPPVAFVLQAVTPMLALCVGGATFSCIFVASLERWHRRASRATASLSRELRDGIARSVQQDRVTILNRDVVPFFSEVLTRGAIVEDDRDRARAIADSIRRVMVAEADRSWLETVIEHAGTDSIHGRDSSGLVQDEQRLASLMTTDQRTAVRALIVAMFDLPSFDPTSLGIVLSTRGHGSRGVFTARAGSADYSVRAALAPYLAVMRVVFSDLQVDISEPALAIRISY
ncbi:MAG: hypothetical protein QOD27_917 [Microbacteriaceae bacterium]|nr:hypothetical protein [Microbacteriaceae bacterium]